jgi:hypothetical protein
MYVLKHKRKMNTEKRKKNHLGFKDHIKKLETSSGLLSKNNDGKKLTVEIQFLQMRKIHQR